MSETMTDHELLKRLVSFDSTSVNSNVPIADFICNYLDDGGNSGNPGNPGYPGARIQRLDGGAQGKLNLLIMKGPDPTDDSGLLFSGHMDVVPAIEPEWESDPFDLIERDGALFGRGSADMKGFDALAINIFKSLDAKTLRRPFGLLLTCDEEVGTLGAQEFAARWSTDQPLPRSVLVGEPTSLRAVRMHKGHLTLKLTLHGISAHSGSPHLGRSAIEPAGRIIQGLSQIQKTLVGEHCDTSVHFPEVPHTVLNVTTIEGGTAINIIPDSCVMHLSIRLLPGQTSQPIVQRVDEVVAREMTNATYDLVVQNESPPMLLDENTSIHRELCDLLGQHKTYGVNYASDGGPFQAGLGMESILCGPGTIDVAHKPNESLPIDEFQKARPLYEKLIERMCVS